MDLSPSSSFSSRSSGQGSNQFFGGIDVGVGGGGGGKGRPSWPPSSLSSPPRTPPLNPSRTSGYQQQQQQQQHEVYSPEQSPKTTAALFFRKDKQRPMRIPTDEEVPPLPTSAINGNGNGNGIAIGGGGGGSFNGNGKMMMVNSNGISSASPRSSNGGFSPSRSQTSPMSPPHPHHSPHHHHQHNVSSSSPTRIPPLPPHRVSQLSRKSVEKGLSEWKRSSSGMMDTRDELIMSLLASEAIVDSRGYEVLTAEEVEDLKKVCKSFIFPLLDPLSISVLKSILTLIIYLGWQTNIGTPNSFHPSHCHLQKTTTRD